MTWTKGAFAVTYEWGDNVRPMMAGYVSGAWAIDKRYSRRWYLTHRPTGYRAGIFLTMADAKAFAEFLETLPVKWSRVTTRRSRTVEPFVERIKDKRAEMRGVR